MEGTRPWRASWTPTRVLPVDQGATETVHVGVQGLLGVQGLRVGVQGLRWPAPRATQAGLGRHHSDVETNLAFTFETRLETSPANAARLVDSPDAFAYLVWPLLRVRPLDGPFGERFRPGPQRLAVRLLGVVPAGVQIVDASWPEDGSGAHELRDVGGNALTRRYDHRIRIEAEGERCRCVDITEVDAGMLTPLVEFAFRMVNGVVARRWPRLLRLANPD